MKFEHLIVINDPSHPEIMPLTRTQLWHGLVLRAEEPRLFVAHLDDCQLSDHTAASVTRECRYGQVTIRDIVTYTSQSHVHYEVPKQLDIEGSHMTMTIEEPQPSAFRVLFSYEDNATDDVSEEEKLYNQFRCSAYEEADNDTIRVIRELAEEGRLG